MGAGGANIPAVNDMLKVFDISFGDALLEGQMTIADEKVYYASGVNIVRFPAGGTLLAYQLADKATAGATLLVSACVQGTFPCRRRESAGEDPHFGNGPPRCCPNLDT